MSQILLVLLLQARIDQNIIYKNHNKFVQVRYEDSTNQVHKYFQSIRQPKRHHKKLIMSTAGFEGSLWYILFHNPQLVVLRP
jgi:hypothetical protein